MTVLLGSDHGGFVIKEELQLWLSELSDPSYDVVDCGAFSMDPDDDYPVFGYQVANGLAKAEEKSDTDPSVWGVLLCRTGAGMAIAANRVSGVRAVVCRNEADVRHARAHNNANVLILEGDHVSPRVAQDLVKLFFTTAFEGGRHQRRVAMLDSYKQS